MEIRKTPEIISRRVHIYLGGDSTVSNYYPIEETEPQPGRFQTGWGQVFCQYVTEENAVTNLAGGGTYAKSWYETAFPGVIQNGQPGDYFLIQAGINDRSYSNEKEMVEYLTYMIDACREKGIIVILATAMQTPKFWKDKNGNELGEYGTPEGSGLASYMEAIRQLAADGKAHRRMVWQGGQNLCDAELSSLQPGNRSGGRYPSFVISWRFEGGGADYHISGADAGGGSDGRLGEYTGRTGIPGDNSL